MWCMQERVHGCMLTRHVLMVPSKVPFLQFLHYPQKPSCQLLSMVPRSSPARGAPRCSPHAYRAGKASPDDLHSKASRTLVFQPQLLDSAAGEDRYFLFRSTLHGTLSMSSLASWLSCLRTFEFLSHAVSLPHAICEDCMLDL